MEDLLLQFKNEVQSYLKTINEDNFSNSYEGLIYIIEKYKKQGLKKDPVAKIITTEINSIDIDEYKEDVLMEISNRIHGFCTSTRAIKW
jgi:hypothetical protein